MNAVIVVLWTIASQYSPGIMSAVAEYREAQGIAICRLCDGYIAAKSCDDIGAVWLLENPITGEWERHQVVDCAMPRGTDDAIEWMERFGIDLEVSYSTAKRWGVVGRGVRIRYKKSGSAGVMLND